jgi:hypothetical protein
MLLPEPGEQCNENERGSADFNQRWPAESGCLDPALAGASDCLASCFETKWKTKWKLRSG